MVWKERKKKKGIEGLFQEAIYMLKKHYSNYLMNKPQLKFLDPVWGTQALCGAWMQDEFLCSDTCLFFIVPLVMQRSSITPDGEMLLCFIVKDRLKDSSGFSVSYSLLLKCPGFHCLFSTPCRKVFSRLWVKDSGIALVLSVLQLEIAASHCTSPIASVSEEKTLLKFNYWDLQFF